MASRLARAGLAGRRGGSASTGGIWDSGLEVQDSWLWAVRVCFGQVSWSSAAVSRGRHGLLFSVDVLSKPGGPRALPPTCSPPLSCSSQNILKAGVCVGHSCSTLNCGSVALCVSWGLGKTETHCVPGSRSRCGQPWFPGRLWGRSCHSSAPQDLHRCHPALTRLVCSFTRCSPREGVG